MDVCHKIKSSSPLSLPRPLVRPFSLSFVSIIDPAHSLTPQAPSIHGRIKPSRPHATFIGVLSIQKLWNTKPKINVWLLHFRKSQVLDCFQNGKSLRFNRTSLEFSSLFIVGPIVYCFCYFYNYFTFFTVRNYFALFFILHHSYFNANNLGSGRGWPPTARATCHVTYGIMCVTCYSCTASTLPSTSLSTSSSPSALRVTCAVCWRLAIALAELHANTSVLLIKLLLPVNWYTVVFIQFQLHVSGLYRYMQMYMCECISTVMLVYIVYK